MDPELFSHGQAEAYAGRTASAPGERVRQIWLEDIMWTVYERAHGQGEKRSARLIFDNGAMVRTRRIYPANWATLPDDELLELSLDW